MNKKSMLILLSTIFLGVGITLVCYKQESAEKSETVLTHMQSGVDTCAVDTVAALPSVPSMSSDVSFVVTENKVTKARACLSVNTPVNTPVTILETGNTNVTGKLPKVAIFDLGDFIMEDTKQVIRKIGVGKMAGYTLTHWRNPIDSCLDALEKMGGEEEYKSSLLFTYKERRMPHCIVAWQQGICNHGEVKNKLLSYIDKIEKSGFFSSKKEKEMTEAIIDIAFDPSQIGDISKPMPAMMKMAQELKEKGYALYAIANIAQEVYEYLKKAYPEVIALFNGVVASHQIKALKCEKRLIEHLCTAYKLDPVDCVLVDKEPTTLQVATDMGMTSIPFMHQKQVRAALKKQGVL